MPSPLLSAPWRRAPLPWRGIDSYDGTPVVFPVAGIYRDLFREQTVRRYWCCS